ncbi:Protein of unknown function (DUF3037) [Stackebrandtia albiflava]|uniref:DUF3037 family protein n=1 Tax=Stackebrandtia albiflava TaxID=406432 RepID=A0A562VEN0_9ACTN|nr:DUF3037 domain-containing protein [Stackebrandtia albiflava]TWJ16343.1 Protein of unknown function (DUF3037) [Stackebrandtia albiflava]
MNAGRVVYEYAVVQVVPRVDRGECMNAGVLLYSQRPLHLSARFALDVDRLRALDPGADEASIRRALDVVARVCAGGPEAGPAAAERLGARFRWLVAPRSTVVRAGPVHTGLTADPEAEAERLLRAMVWPVGNPVDGAGGGL